MELIVNYCVCCVLWFEVVSCRAHRRQHIYRRQRHPDRVRSLRGRHAGDDRSWIEHCGCVAQQNPARLSVPLATHSIGNGVARNKECRPRSCWLWNCHCRPVSVREAGVRRSHTTGPRARLSWRSTRTWQLLHKRPTLWYSGSRRLNSEHWTVSDTVTGRYEAVVCFRQLSPVRARLFIGTVCGQSRGPGACAFGHASRHTVCDCDICSLVINRLKTALQFLDSWTASNDWARSGRVTRHSSAQNMGRVGSSKSDPRPTGAEPADHCCMLHTTGRLMQTTLHKFKISRLCGVGSVYSIVTFHSRKYCHPRLFNEQNSIYQNVMLQCKYNLYNVHNNNIIIILFAFQKQQMSSQTGDRRPERHGTWGRLQCRIFNRALQGRNCR